MLEMSAFGSLYGDQFHFALSTEMIHPNFHNLMSTTPFMSSSAACRSKLFANLASGGRIQRFLLWHGIIFSFGFSSGLTLE